jgi:hypothetical protein
MDGFCQCPRCGDQGFERLDSYAHCVSCLYFEDYHHDAEKSYFEARRAEQLLEEEDEGSPEDQFEAEEQPALVS